MKAYIVGGAVRDRLLGLPVQDRDWVVVGATPQEMIDAGYAPVGRDFPVFLHPTSREEYALARTERKSGRGYHGFTFHAAPDVTLQQDLARRDLTINAIAEDPETGELIDPFGGRADLARRVLRHVSPAFAEDPVRLLRCARFAARFGEFTVAPETMALMRALVAAGEVDALVPERVWQELARGLMQPRPDRMVELLRETGALARLLPQIDARFDAGERERIARTLIACAAAGAVLPVRFACLCSGLAPAAVQAIGERWRVDGASRALALLAARELDAVSRGGTDAGAVAALFDRADAWRRPRRFAELLQVASCVARAGQSGNPPGACLAAALAAALAVDTRAVSARALADGLVGAAIGERLRTARTAAVATALRNAGRS